MEVLGEYINPNHATVNQKIPLNSYKIYVAEYLKSLTIWENDSDANTNIILPEQLTTVNILNVINTIQQFGTGLNEVYKIRKYKLGNGLLYNSDISGSTLAATIKIKKLRIVKGELKVKKQLNTPGLIYESFFFEIHPEDVKLLPNNKDKYLYIITEPTSESLINISLSNPLEF